jgi:hypothetical protein
VEVRVVCLRYAGDGSQLTCEYGIVIVTVTSCPGDALEGGLGETVVEAPEIPALVK